MWGLRVKKLKDIKLPSLPALDPSGRTPGEVFFTERISGRNQRNQVTSIQKTEAMRDAAGRRD